MDTRLVSSSDAGPPAIDGGLRHHTNVEVQASGIELRDLGRSLVRARFLVLAITALAVGAALAVTALQEREYMAEATLFVSPPRSAGGLNREVAGLAGLASLVDLGQSSIAVEAAILGSRQIAESVVDSLSLHVRLVSPRVSRINVFEVLDAPRDAPTGVYEFRRLADGSYSVQSQQQQPPDNLPSRVYAGRPFSLGSVSLVLTPHVGPDPPTKLVIAVDDFQAAVQSVRQALMIVPTGPGTQVLSVRARMADSVLAAAIPNAATQSLILYRSTVSNEDARRTVRFLEDQVAHYAALLEDAEARLQAYQEQDRIVSPSDQASQQIRQVSDMQARRDLLVTEREAISRLLSRAESGVQSTGGSSPFRELASFPVFISNAAVQNVLRVLTDLENQRAELIVRRTPENLDVQRIDRRIGELELQLHAMARSYRDGLNNQIASLDEALSQFGVKLESIPAQQVTFARLTREKQLLEEIYTLLQSRLKEAEIRQAAEPTDVRILDAALIPERPVSPRPALNLILGLMLGLMLATGTALARAILDPKVRSRADAISATSRLPVVGMIPTLEAAQVNGASTRTRYMLERIFRSRASAPAPAPTLVTRTDPSGWAAEAYRSLRTNLTLHDLDQASRVIVICSAAEGDGKSTSAANLAVTTAQQGIRTLLIDCDLRKPGLHQLFGLDPAPGITDVLLAGASVESSVRQVDVGNGEVPLGVLPAGSPSPHPAELVGSRAMKELLEQLRGSYDMLILDVPPLGSAVDAAVLGALADSTILVTRATFSHKRAVAEAVAQLRQLNIKLGGVIINDVDPTELPYPYDRYGTYASSGGR